MIHASPGPGLTIELQYSAPGGGDMAFTIPGGTTAKVPSGLPPVSISMTSESSVEFSISLGGGPILCVTLDEETDIIHEMITLNTLITSSTEWSGGFNDEAGKYVFTNALFNNLSIQVVSPPTPDAPSIGILVVGTVDAPLK